MRKTTKWICLFLTLALLLTCADAFGEEGQGHETATARIRFNMRQAMDTTSKVVRNIAPKTKVTVLSFEADGWCRIRYGSAEGYAKTEWLILQEGSAGSVPAPTETPEPEDEDEDEEIPPVQRDDGRGSQTPQATGEPVTPTLASFNPRTATAEPTGVRVGETDSDEVIYYALTTTACALREAPEEQAKRIREIKYRKKVRVLAYGDEWCKVQTRDGSYTGYLKTRWLFHFHSPDPFQYDIPWYSSYRPTGYVTMTRPVHITDQKDLYGGQDLQVGDLICVQLREDQDYDFILRRDFITFSGDTGEYRPFVNWQEAKEGDIIGGFTVHYGLTQGGAFTRNRKRNIALAMSRMDGTVIPSGAKYSFLDNVGPVTVWGGYKTAGITGGDGIGTGGGICHTSTLTYQAALCVPFYIYEREPHTDDGTHYTLLEFDATVGGYSDMIFYNTFPYDVKEHAFLDKASGTITILWECLETVDKEVLRSWDWHSLKIPASKDEK